MKLGIEFEMVIFYKYRRSLDEFMSALRRYGSFKNDGSISVKSEEQYIANKSIGSGSNYLATEFVTDPFTDLDKLLEYIKSTMIRETICINPPTPASVPSQTKIILFFNSSTGTHIHYSLEMTNTKTSGTNAYGTKGITKELQILRADPKIADKMATWIISNVRNKSLVAGMNRPYNDRLTNTYNRSSRINISNSHGHGTVEFRLFHLWGVTKANLIATLQDYFALIHASMKIAYTEALNRPELLINETVKEIDSTKSTLTAYQKQLESYEKQMQSLKKKVQSLEAKKKRQKTGLDKSIKRLDKKLDKTYFDNKMVLSYNKKIGDE